MIGVIVPAHNEEALIGPCLRSIQRAARDPLLGGEKVLVVVAADACTDATAQIAERHDCYVIELAARCVGKARSVATDFAISSGARWIASTDADSVVPPNWLSAQLFHDHAAVCGTIRLRHTSSLPLSLLQRYGERYRFQDGHSHIHGANLGVSSEAYLHCGGFPHIPAHEDVGLIDALQKADVAVAWRVYPWVYTSARMDARAPNGLGAYLRTLHQS